MKVTLRIEGEKSRICKVPYPQADHVVVEGACPKCEAIPFTAGGVKGTMVRGRDTYTSEAGCMKCGETVGKIVVHVDTIFGIEEDERVLNGRARVY